MEDIIVCGIDEAGRGPLWGPVTAAAVIFPPGIHPKGLKDSKKLSSGQRESLEERIRRDCFWGLGWADTQEIDEINILQASLLSMVRAWKDLLANYEPALVEQFGLQTILQSGTGFLGMISILTDGSIAPKIDAIEVKPIVKGDSLIPEISAASILAKTARDRWVNQWVEKNDPDDLYGLKKHKGYPTKHHREMIQLHGSSNLHRKSFKVSTT